MKQPEDAVALGVLTESEHIIFRKSQFTTYSFLFACINANEHYMGLEAVAIVSFKKSQ